MPGSPAAGAGLARDDVLIGLAGRPISSLAEYSQLLRAHAPGDTVTVEFLRGAERLSRRVVLAERR
jgi:S1-C subfamily serine protease